MKKVFALSVLVVFLLSVAGGQFLLFKAYRLHVRSLAKAALREMAASEADVIAFSKSDFSHGLPFFRVPDKDDEIILHGEFYDVKDVEISDDSIFLFAYRDSDEKFLVAQFEKSARENDQSPLAVLLQQFTNIFTFIPVSVEFSPVVNHASDIVFIVSNGIYSFVNADVISPPPRLI
ncbi:MAG: hypothetical protein AB7V36_03800 [Bacteroidales bacterium]